MAKTRTDNCSPLVQELLRCQEWIEAALEYTGGTHSFEDVVRGILDGRMQLWPGENACAVTEIVIYPQQQTLHVFLAGGKMEEIVAMQKDAAEWGKAQGCSRMTIAGRKGWSKVLKEHGYKEQFTVLEVEI